MVLMLRNAVLTSCNATAAAVVVVAVDVVVAVAVAVAVAVVLVSYACMAWRNASYAAVTGVDDVCGSTPV